MNKISCRRTEISTLEDIRNAKIPSIGESYFKGRGKRRVKVSVKKVFSHSKAGVLVEYTMSNGDMGVCLSHYWWDMMKEAREDN